MNGSSVGLQALVMATCLPGETLLLPRASHMSAIAGLVLAGARPRFVGPSWDPDPELPAVPSPTEWEAALAATPEARAALVTRPDYFGRACDLEAIARLCHDRGLPLLVDEAHGPHLGLDPRLPAPALALGADAAVQSTHKVLTAFTQASMLHLRGDRVDAMRVRRALRVLQTTSPSFLLLASLDAARDQRSRTGRPEWGALLDRTLALRARLEAQGLTLLGSRGPEGAWDPGRLVLDLGAEGPNGYAIADALHDAHRIQVELATPRHVGLILTPGHDAETLALLERALVEVVRAPASTRPQIGLPPAPPLVRLPREAFLGAVTRKPLAKTAGDVAAELVCPYPPGLPVLLPGERITAEVLDYLEGLRALGAEFAGSDDPGLDTLLVTAPSCDTIPSSRAIAATSS